MRLLQFMREEGLDDEAMASLIGDCSAHAVKKWKYGEREPDAMTMLRIESVTGSKVRMPDWAEQTAQKRATLAAASRTEALSA